MERSDRFGNFTFSFSPLLAPSQDITAEARTTSRNPPGTAGRASSFLQLQGQSMMLPVAGSFAARARRANLAESLRIREAGALNEEDLKRLRGGFISGQLGLYLPTRAGCTAASSLSPNKPTKTKVPSPHRAFSVLWCRSRPRWEPRRCSFHLSKF